MGSPPRRRSPPRARSAETPAVRLYLDSNVFDHICAMGEQDDFDAWLRVRSCEVMLSGELLHEVLPISDPSRRRARLSLMTRVPRKYLDPAAYLHAQEVLSEIQRLRPHWLTMFPDTSSIGAWLKGSKQQWIQAKLQPERLAEAYAEHYRPVADPGIASVREAQKSQRAALLQAADSLHGVRLGSYFVAIPGARLDDQEVMWRVGCLVVWHHALFDRPEVMRDYVDYLEPYLRGLPDVADFTAFWLSEVERGPLRRNATVSLLDREQLNAQITRGNALDALHATYIFDAHYFITGDRQFHKVLEAVALSMGAPAVPLLVDRGAPSAVAELERVLGPASRELRDLSNPVTE